MPIVDPSSIVIKQDIKFKSLSDHDTVAWEGTVAGFLNYDAAKTMEDILPYYREAKKAITDLPPIEELTFFILKLDENTAITKYRVFALEYIDPSTLRIQDVHSDLYFKVYATPESEVPTIITLLKAHGYNCSQVTSIS